MGNVAIFKGKLVKFLAKAGILVPTRGDADRSGMPAAGETAFNTDANKLEVYDGTTWAQLEPSRGNGLVHPSAGTTFEYNSYSPLLQPGATQNTAIGSLALSSLYNGTNNTAIGYAALQNATISTDNIAIGPFALQNTTASTANYNIAMGSYSLYSLSNLSANYNVGIGFGALTSFSTGNENVAIGSNAGSQLFSGNYNTFINSNTNSGLPGFNGVVNIGKNSSGLGGTVTADNDFILGTISHRYKMDGIIKSGIKLGQSTNDTSYVTLRSATTGTPVTWTLPVSNGNSGDVLTTNGTGTLSWSPASGGSYTLQSLTGVQNRTAWVDRLSKLHTKNANAITRASVFFTSATMVSTGAYYGGVYAPTVNKIFLVPYAQVGQTNWHYIDCITGNLVAYPKPTNAYAGLNFAGGVYCPVLDRVYFIPSYTSPSPFRPMYYIDCKTAIFQSASSGPSELPGSSTELNNTTGTNSYRGGVYSPTQNRIYLIPFSQSSSSTWHYIDCVAGTLVGYNKGITLSTSGAYSGGAYSPTQNRIYMAPNQQSNQSTWHYIDCATGTIVPYTHGTGMTTIGAYAGAVYSPTQNRIYFVPAERGDSTTWHYVDCDTGSIVAYDRGSDPVPSIGDIYNGGVYMPTTNRIYFIPNYNIAPQTVFHYIDCNTGAVVTYAKPTYTTSANSFAGGTYCPIQNKIYFVPYASNTLIGYVASTSKPDLEPHELGSTLISSTL